MPDTSQMKRILTLTLNPAVDIGSGVDALVSGKKLRCDAPTIAAGGGGINVSRALRQLGIDSTAVFPSGGYFGDCQQDLLKAEGVRCETYRTENGLQRVNYNIRDKSDDRLYRFCLPGAEIQQDDWQRALDRIAELIAPDTILVVSGSRPPGVPADFHARIASLVNEVDGLLILDEPGGIFRSQGDYSVDWVAPNRREFEQMIGRSCEPKDLPHELDAFVSESSVGNVLLTMGSEGVIYAGAEGSHRIAAPEIETASAVGAGDSAVAGLACALAAGKPHRSAVCWAVAAGTAAAAAPIGRLLDEGAFKRLLAAIEAEHGGAG